MSGWIQAAIQQNTILFKIAYLASNVYFVIIKNTKDPHTPGIIGLSGIE